eukprot:jgi/Psemu1/324399/estExt_fgenesh1_pg.C_1430008
MNVTFDPNIPSDESHQSKKKGLKKLGASIKKVFGGKKRRRRKKLAREGEGKGQPTDNRSYVSYDQSDAGDSGVYSYQDVASAQRIGNKTSLSRIKEGANEDGSDFEDVSPRQKNNGRSRNRNRKGGDSETSGSSKGSGWLGNRQKKSADLLSLVVLLVDPSSLRFELLSLDFDLGGSTKLKRNSNSNNPPELKLTVQDVLDQITPETLTEEKLKAGVFKAGGCRALIDRTGQLHFGTASLEKACASRPLRAVDRARARININNRAGKPASGKGECLLSIPTYAGEPHRDVLLGFCADDERITEVARDVARALDLARPIFADPNVVNLMESNGYDLTGWKAGTSVEKNVTNKSDSSTTNRSSSHNTMLMPQQKTPKKSRPWSKSPLAKAAVALLSMALATALAFALVSGGLNMIPSISSGDSTGSGSTNDGYQTFPEYVNLAYGYARSWYSAGKGGAIASKTTRV